jgi:diadenosine tetraphosphate (Ap4A) HIT family hydrolase
MVFELHPRLAVGGCEIGRLGGCILLLKNNALFPWFILVPEVVGIEDLHQLPPDQYAEVFFAMRRVSEFVSIHFQSEKLNVACIGNQVRQMHIHIVGRTTGDPAWPGTVWASEGKRPYTDEEIETIRSAARILLGLS